MYSARQRELKKVDEDMLDEDGCLKTNEELGKLGKLGQAWRYFACLVITVVFCSIVLGVGLPLWVVYFSAVVTKRFLQCFGKEVPECLEKFLQTFSPPRLSLIRSIIAGEADWYHYTGHFFDKLVLHVLHDPLTSLGLPRSWRGSAFNWWVCTCR